MAQDSLQVFIVDWREIVNTTMEFEDFFKISVDLTNTRRMRLPDKSVFVDPNGKRIIPREIEALFDKCLYLMSECGYGIQDDTLKHYGWLPAPYLDDEELKFMTTAPTGRRVISWASYIDQKKRFEEAA
jgi:hypothetical protein